MVASAFAGVMALGFVMNPMPARHVPIRSNGVVMQGNPLAKFFGGGDDKKKKESALTTGLDALCGCLLIKPMSRFRTRLRQLTLL